MQINHRVRHERRQLCAGRQILLVHFAKIIRLCPERSQDALFSRIFASSFFENSLGCIKSETRKPVRAALSP